MRSDSSTRENQATPSRRRSPWPRRFLLATAVAVTLVVAAGLVVVVMIRGSLPDLTGTRTLDGLEDKVTIRRDALGVPTIEGESQRDVLFALGFLHGQERFFQMDLLRRSSEGALSNLFGAVALDRDRDARRHRFLATAQRAVAALPPDQRALLDVYTMGVNRGLETLDQVPFEYLLLRTEPEPWRVEDAVLVLAAMYMQLQSDYDRHETHRAVMNQHLPADMAAFLTQWGSRWDAPNVGEAYQPLAPPAPEVFNLRRQASLPVPAAPADTEKASLIGSNNWAVGGALTEHGHALVADDMHLGISVPNTWYRADLKFPDESAPSGRRRVTGVTLPGALAVIAGSNGQVAWGFTNSYGDWTDMVVVEPVPGREGFYQTPDGPKAYEEVVETINVKGGGPVELRFQTTIWGPLVGHDHEDRPLALRWVAHEAHAFNLNLLDMMKVANVDDALAVAQTCGIPAQNFVTGDAQGAVAWTIMGVIPRKKGEVGQVPHSWADGRNGWDGWLTPAEYPVITRPDHHRIWTANARVLDLEQQKKILGNGAYALGARAKQIRDRLFEKEQFDEAALFAIQRDHEARYLTEWREMLLRHLDEDAAAKGLRRGKFRELVLNWSGHAEPNDAGYYLVRAYRVAVIDHLLAFLVQRCREVDPNFRPWYINQRDGVTWTLLEQEPFHLLPPEYESWRAYNLARIDELIEKLTADGDTLAAHTWGRHNQAFFRHPFSTILPALSDWLDMPLMPLQGDAHMPMVQRETHGASQRMVVAPGLEEQGIMQMPCGQSGHPLSPFYRAGHREWAEGKPTPFLPGETVYQLTLVPR